jgi:hypothetical protein
MMGPLCHTRPFFPSSSRSMMLLSPPLLAVNCLSRSLPGGPGPPSSPPPGLTPFSLGSRQHPAPLSDTMLNYTVGKNGLRVKHIINKTAIWSTFNTKVYKYTESYNQSCVCYGEVLRHYFFYGSYSPSLPDISLTFLPKK